MISHKCAECTLPLKGFILKFYIVFVIFIKFKLKRSCFEFSLNKVEKMKTPQELSGELIEYSRFVLPAFVARIFMITHK